MNVTAGINAANLNAESSGLPQIVGTKEAAAPFKGLLQDAIGQMDALEAQGRAAVVGLMTGKGVDVHQAVIATQKTEMAFELALSVRNKAVQAYQSVMNMQF